MHSPEGSARYKMIYIALAGDMATALLSVASWSHFEPIRNELTIKIRKTQKHI